VARDRKRAKQRRARSQPAAQRARRTPDPGSTPTPEPTEHASAEAEIAEAAVAGADVAEWEPAGPLEPDELPQPDELEGLDDAGDEEEAGAGTPQRQAQRRREEHREGNRVVNFLRACWAELQRVQWPDRRQVIQATAVTLGFVAIAGGYLGLMDALFSRLVNAIL